MKISTTETEEVFKVKKTILFIFLILCVGLLAGCDVFGNNVKVATREYCLENPKDVICDGFDTTDPVDILANTFFNAMIEDYNEDTDGFACETYFVDSLATLCETETDYFSPVGYNSFELNVMKNETVDGSNYEYVLTVKTNIITENIEYTIGLQVEEEVLKIDSWSYQLVDNTELSSFQLTAYNFMFDYNNTEMLDNDVCSKWIKDEIDASNCVLIRRSRQMNDISLELTSVIEGRYNIATYKLVNSSGESSTSEKYAVFSTGKMSTGEWEFRLTDEFNIDSYKFINDFVNDSADFHDACEMLDSGVTNCKGRRSTYLETGIRELVSANALSNGYIDGYITFSNIFSIRLEDDSLVQIYLRCRIINQEHVYDVVDYYE